MLAGRAGDRLADALSTPVSRSTLLRLVRSLPEAAPLVPRVLGIDVRAAQGACLRHDVDVETRRPVDVLPDRTIATVRT